MIYFITLQKYLHILLYTSECIFYLLYYKDYINIA